MHVLFVGGKQHGTTSYVTGDFIALDATGSYRVSDTVAASILGHSYRVALHVGLSTFEDWEIKEQIQLALDIAMPTIASPREFECVGHAADLVLGSEKRTVAGVAGRLLEEVVELCLAAGLTTEQIYGHATDSIYNQYVKVSKASGGILYPSSYRFQFNKEELAGEIGDVRVMLEDVAYRAGLSCDFCYEDRKLAFYQKVKDGRFYANEKGLLYVRKPHMDFTK